MYTYDATPTCNILCIDDAYMVVSHYLQTTQNKQSPAYFIRKTGRFGEKIDDLYTIYKKNLDNIIRKRATIIDENKIGNFKQELQKMGG